MKVELTYFKETGTWYTKAEIELNFYYDFEVYDKIRDMNKKDKMPKLISGHWNGYVLVQPEDNPPALLDFTKDL